MQTLEQSIHEVAAKPQRRQREKAVLGNLQKAVRTKVYHETAKTKKLGAPEREYDEVIGLKVIESVGQGFSITKACKEHGICLDILYQWIDSDKNFAERYRRAKQGMAQALVDEMVESTKTLDNESALVGRVKAQVFQWVAARYSPSDFSDTRKIELSGEVHHKHSHELSQDQKKRIAEAWMLSQQEQDTPGISAETSGPTLIDLEAEAISQEEPKPEPPPRRKPSPTGKPKGKEGKPTKKVSNTRGRPRKLGIDDPAD